MTCVVFSGRSFARSGECYLRPNGEIKNMGTDPHPALRATLSQGERDLDSGALSPGRGWREAPGEGPSPYSPYSPIPLTAPVITTHNLSLKCTRGADRAQEEKEKERLCGSREDSSDRHRHWHWCLWGASNLHQLRRKRRKCRVLNLQPSRPSSAADIW